MGGRAGLVFLVGLVVLVELVGRGLGWGFGRGRLGVEVGFGLGAERVPGVVGLAIGGTRALGVGFAPGVVPAPGAERAVDIEVGRWFGIVAGIGLEIDMRPVVEVGVV